MFTNCLVELYASGNPSLYHLSIIVLFLGHLGTILLAIVQEAIPRLVLGMAMGPQTILQLRMTCILAMGATWQDLLSAW